MGLGILEDRVLVDHVPETWQNPQPSDDPNDPLNWPLWRRDLITFILSLTAIFATALGPILAANTLTLSVWFKLNFTYIALLTGYFLLGVGVAGFFFVPSGRIWGKRHLFILGLIILISTSAWAGAVGHNYTSLLWARIIQGVGTAPFEGLVNAAVGDLYFVHERGKRMAFTNLAVFGGAFFTPILVGTITHTIRWWWTFNLVAIFCAASLIAVFLFCPETAYRRDAALNTDIVSHKPHGDHIDKNKEKAAYRRNAALNPDIVSCRPQDDHSNQNQEKSAHRRDAALNTDIHGTTAPITPPVLRPKKTFAQSLALFDGRKTDESFYKLLFRPVPLFTQPAFLWAALIQGTMIGWTVFIGVILAAIFLGPPLFWGEVQTGNTYTGAFVGALLGFFTAGIFADWSAKALTRLNGGIYEPEFRILLVIPQLIFGVTGLFGFAITAQGTLEGQYHWIVPIVFFGFEVAGTVIGAVASSLYIVDAYRDLAIEGFTCLIIFKNLFSFGLTFKAYDWLVQSGIREVFFTLGAVQIVVCLLSVPMYIFGKRNRSFFHRHDLLEMFGLR
ncbi:major facilitator superfamily transporter [Xylariaceae sp. FL1651]|nr:major facilitator superfamily transporter [Xylariaceae sp. FL1651]